MQDFIDGKVDAFLACHQRVLGVRAREDRSHRWQLPSTARGRSITAAWSPAAPDYVDKYPLATKRVLRAILKSADLLRVGPERVARQLVDRGVPPSYDVRADDPCRIPLHDNWRDYDAEDSLRFYALR